MKKLIFILYTLIWIGYIFHFSFQNNIESAKESNDFIEKMENFLSIFHVYLSLNIYSAIIRNFAHIFEYIVLSILLLTIIKEYEFIYRSFVAFSLSTFIALIDEGIQYFIKSRVSSVIDVFIDLIGVFIGCIIFKIFITLKREKNYFNIFFNS